MDAGDIFSMQRGNEAMKKKWFVSKAAAVTHGVNKDTFGVGRNTTRGDAITFIFRSTLTW